MNLTNPYAEVIDLDRLMAESRRLYRECKPRHQPDALARNRAQALLIQVHARINQLSQ